MLRMVLKVFDTVSCGRSKCWRMRSLPPAVGMAPVRSDNSWPATRSLFHRVSSFSTLAANPSRAFLL